MSWFDRFRGVRTRGYPTSANRASSFHLSWRFPPDTPPVATVAATLEVVEPPVVDELYFWALQASFVEAGRRHGAAHLGLQWYPAHPGHTAVNWGGYRPDGRTLDGTASPLPSAPANANTRDFAWAARHPYELRIARGARGWAGSVGGVVVRELYAGGDALADVVVWSEVFARCDAPSVAVRWSGLRGVTTDGTVVEPEGVVTSYQSAGAGGCTNTDSSPDAGGFLQRTNCSRVSPAGALLSAE